MYNQTFAIGPYTPAVVDEQSGKASQNQLAVVDGENFAWRASGVFSAFGHEEVGFSLFSSASHDNAFKVMDDVWHLTSDAVWSFKSGAWTIIHEWPEVDQDDPDLEWKWEPDDYRWTYAYVGTRHWFCHPSFGLFYYDQFDNTWGKYRSEHWDCPTWAITHSDNRLVVLLNDVVTWSMFDRGENFDDETWACGTGAQSLALVRYGQPLGVIPYFDGFVTFTTMGTMLSMPNTQPMQDPDGQRLIIGAVVFQHQEVSWEAAPLGPTSIITIDDKSGVWLSNKGIMQISPGQGGSQAAITDLDPAMTLFYTENILPVARGKQFGEFKLDYMPDVDCFSISSGWTGSLYERAHIYQRKLQRWANFNFRHRHMVQLGNAETRDLDETRFGFMNFARRLCIVDHRPHQFSWIRFSPARLEAPNEQIPAAALMELMSLRFGVGRPPWVTAVPMALRSSYRNDKRRAWAENRNSVYVAGGWDSDTQNVDEGLRAHPVLRGENVHYYVISCTGITHSIMVVCETADDFFEINHVEATFAFAGIL